MKYDIFICYRREGGAQYARILQLMLAQRGYNVFLDYNDLMDGIFSETIKDAIKEAPIFMLVLSRDSLNRCANDGDWVGREIQYAASHERHIIPVNPDNQFNGVPENCPIDIKRIVILNQHSDVQFGQPLEATIDTMIKKRIAPKVGSREAFVTTDPVVSKKASRLRKFFFSIMATAIIALSGLLIWQLTAKSRTLLLFMGGGSVEKLIKEEGKLDIEGYDQSTYIHIPTGYIWSMLKEDYAEYLDCKEDVDKMQYVTLCLAASRMNKDSIQNMVSTSENFANKAVVIECYIGDDLLTLYIKKDLCDKYHFPKDGSSLPIDSLLSLIKYRKGNGDFNIYSTNIKSGTLDTYQAKIDLYASEKGKDYSLEKLINDSIIYTFNSADEAPEGNYVIMGSKYYHWDSLMKRDATNGYCHYPIINGEKPTYLYFVAYRKAGGIIEIPSPILKFLKETPFTQKYGKDKWEKVLNNEYQREGTVMMLTTRPEKKQQ